MRLQPSDGLFARSDAVLHLEGECSVEKSLEGWTRGEACGNQVAAGEQGFGNEGLMGEGGQLLGEEPVIIQHAVAARAIHPMQLEFVLKSLPSHEPAQGRGPHVADILERHVICDGADGGVDVGAREPQACEDVFGHFGTDLFVS